MAENLDYRYHAFLSHNSGDKALVEPIARALHEAGIRVFYDDWEMTPGAPAGDLIDGAFEASGAVLVFLGPNGFGPIHRDEVRTAGDEANRKGKPLTLVKLPGAKLSDAGIPSALRNRVFVEFNSTNPNDQGFKVAVWKCQWAVSGVKPPQLDSYQKAPQASTGAPAEPRSVSELDTLDRFQAAVRNYGLVLLLGRSWESQLSGTESTRLARQLLPKVLADPALTDQPLRPSLDDIASCADEVVGEERVKEVLQDAYRDSRSTALDEPARSSLQQFFRHWLHATVAAPERSDLLLVSTSIGLGLEHLLIESSMPFVRVVLKSLAPEPQIVVQDFRDCADGSSKSLTVSPSATGAVSSGNAATAQVGDLLPRGGSRRRIVLLKWMGSVDVADSCLLTRGQISRFSELLGRGSSLRSYLDSALTSRAVLMAGLRVLDEDFLLLRSLVLDPVFRLAPRRMRLWIDPGYPQEPRTLAEHAQRDHGERLRKQLPINLYGVTPVSESMHEFLVRFRCSVEEAQP